MSARGELDGMINPTTASGQSMLNQQDRTEEVEKIAVGVFLSEDPINAAADGWLSISGKKPQKIAGASKIPNDVLTVSNLSRQAFDNLRSLKNLRASWFFGKEAQAVSADMGAPMSYNQENLDIISQITSRVFQNTLNFTGKAYQFSSSRPFTNFSLAQDIQEAVGITSGNNKTPEFDKQAFVAAYQSDSIAFDLTYAEAYGADENNKLHHVTLSLNRVDHLCWLCKQPMPFERNWVHLSAQDMGQTDLERVAFIFRSQQPLLAEIEIVGYHDETQAPLLAFGSSTRDKTKKTGTVRTHATDIEILWLSQFTSSIKVHSAWMSPSYNPLPLNLQPPAELTQDPLLRLSYSAGLVAFNHFQALSQSTYITQSRVGELRHGYSIRNVWLKAYDRAEMALHAFKAWERGIRVTGYGAGSLRVAVKRDEISKLMEFAIERGFYTPNFLSLSDSLGADLTGRQFAGALDHESESDGLSSRSDDESQTAAFIRPKSVVKAQNIQQQVTAQEIRPLTPALGPSVRGEEGSMPNPLPISAASETAGIVSQANARSEGPSQLTSQLPSQLPSHLTHQSPSAAPADHPPQQTPARRTLSIPRLARPGQTTAHNESAAPVKASAPSAMAHSDQAANASPPGPLTNSMNGSMNDSAGPSANHPARATTPNIPVATTTAAPIDPNDAVNQLLFSSSAHVSGQPSGRPPSDAFEFSDDSDELNEDELNEDDLTGDLIGDLNEEDLLDLNLSQTQKISESADDITEGIGWGRESTEPAPTNSPQTQQANSWASQQARAGRIFTPDRALIQDNRAVNAFLPPGFLDD